MDREVWRDRVATNLGMEPEAVDADFDRMAVGGITFDEPRSWPFLKAIIYEYEEWVIALEHDTKPRRMERIARKLGVPLHEASSRIDELEQIFERSLDDPVELARIGVALRLYELHRDEMPPLGDSRWLEPRRPSWADDGDRALTQR